MWVIITGDFNDLDTRRLQKSFRLKQLVNFPTRGRNTLDLILTNLKDFYEFPIKRPPFALSDHMSVEIQPKSREKLPKTVVTTKTRDLRPSNRVAIRTYLQSLDVSSMIAKAESCEQKVSLLEMIIKTGLDTVSPVRSKRICTTEPPWITNSLRQLIKDRQRALSHNDIDEFKRLTNRINRKRKECCAEYYQSKVQHLKNTKPSIWWREVKKLSGMSPVAGTRDKVSTSLEQLYGISDKSTLANIVNDAFLSPMRSFTPLALDYWRHLVEGLTDDSDIAVTVDTVQKKLSKLNGSKAQGPDGIPGWLLKENADVFAKPVADIISCSFRKGCLPASWKEADITPIPKVKLIQQVCEHLRPISLTSILSKLAENFVVNEYVKPAVMEKLDPRQFGAVPRSNTRHALISMIHSWSQSTDGNGATTRVVLFDFRKAFDLVDHRILVEKISEYTIPRRIICWIVDF